MSTTTSTPITPQAFTQAIRTLPLANLHLKASELQNSIAHLQSSAIELRRWAEAGDEECAEALVENEDVVVRMEERIGLLRREVESRGFPWGEIAGEDEEEKEEGGVGGREEVVGDGRVDGAEGGTHGSRRERTREGARRTGDLEVTGGRREGGSLSDEELARRLMERLEADEEEDAGDGVHL